MRLKKLSDITDSGRFLSRNSHRSRRNQAPDGTGWFHTLKPRGAPAPIIGDEVHAGGAARAGGAAALVHLRLAQRALEAERAHADEAAVAVHAAAPLGAPLAGAVVHVLLTAGARVASGAGAASKTQETRGELFSTESSLAGSGRSSRSEKQLRTPKSHLTFSPLPIGQLLSKCPFYRLS